LQGCSRLSIFVAVGQKMNLCSSRQDLYNQQRCNEYSLFTSNSRLAISGEVDSLLVTRGGGSDSGSAAAATATAAVAAAAARAVFQTTKATNVVMAAWSSVKQTGCVINRRMIIPC
jgi:hypothetical protein